MMGTGPVEVQAVCEVVLGELAGAFPTTQVTGSSAQWAGALGSLQQVIDTASAAQDAVIARLAAIEPVVLEDGTIAETHRALGHAALDTPAIVSGVLNVAPVHAEHRVRAALALAADGPAGTATATGLGGLHPRWPPALWTPTGPVSSPPSWPKHPRRSPPPSSPPWRGTSGPRTPRTYAGAAGGCWPGSAPTCWSNAPAAPAKSAGCAAGPTNPASTSGWAPSPPKTPPRPGPRSTPWPTNTSTTVPARTSNEPAPKP